MRGGTRPLSASLARIEAWRPERLFLTHFGPFEQPTAHLRALRSWMAEARAVAESVRGEESRGEAARGPEFARRLRDLIAGRAGAEAAAAYARAVPFEHCWLGLERYLSRE